MIKSTVMISKNLEQDKTPRLYYSMNANTVLDHRCSDGLNRTNMSGRSPGAHNTVQNSETIRTFIKNRSGLFIHTFVSTLSAEKILWEWIKM